MIRQPSQLVGELREDVVADRRDVVDELAEPVARQDERLRRLDGPITQGELAAMVGSTRQSVNKLLGFFVDDGLIRMERDAIVIQDLGGLQRAARR